MVDGVFLLASLVLFATFGKQEERVKGYSDIILIIWNQGVNRVHQGRKIVNYFCLHAFCSCSFYSVLCESSCWGSRPLF